MRVVFERCLAFLSKVTSLQDTPDRENPGFGIFTSELGRTRQAEGS